MATNSDVESASGETVEIPPEVAKLNKRLEHLEAIAREYQITVRVVAVLAERLLEASGGDVVVITDEALADSSSMEAGREVALSQVWIRVSR